MTAVKEGYLLLTDTGLLFSKLIKFYTKKPYNHASIAFDSNLTEVYSFGRKSMRNPFKSGFVKEEMTSNSFDKADSIIYSFEVTDAQLKMMRSFIQDINEQQQQYKYNFLGLFGFIIKRPIKRKKAFFCSQFVASVLNEGMVIKFDRPLSLISPNDLQQISTLRLVYQGKIGAYTNNGGI